LRDALSASASNVEPKAMEVLVRLAESPGEIVSKEQLMHAAWAET